MMSRKVDTYRLTKAPLAIRCNPDAMTVSALTSHMHCTNRLPVKATTLAKPKLTNVARQSLSAMLRHASPAPCGNAIRCQA